MSSKLREALSDACYAMFNFLKTQNGGYEEDSSRYYSYNARECDVCDLWKLKGETND